MCGWGPLYCQYSQLPGASASPMKPLSTEHQREQPALGARGWLWSLVPRAAINNEGLLCGAAQHRCQVQRQITRRCGQRSPSAKRCISPTFPNRSTMGTLQFVAQLQSVQCYTSKVNLRLVGVFPMFFGVAGMFFYIHTNAKLYRWHTKNPIEAAAFTEAISNRLSCDRWQPQEDCCPAREGTATCITVRCSGLLCYFAIIGKYKVADDVFTPI